MSSVSFRNFAEIAAEEIVPLLAGSLSNSGVATKTIEYFTWKHVRSPFGPSTGLVAISVPNGDVVATRPLMQWRLYSAGVCIGAFRPVDTVTDPAWRGKGLFSQLTLAAVEQLSSDSPGGVIFNTPNANSLPGYLKIGWREVCQLDLCVRPGSCLAWIRAVCRHWWSRGQSGQSKVVEAIQCEDMSVAFRERVLEFCSRRDSARNRHGLRTVRSEDYLRWRYLEHPNTRYTFVISRHAEEILSVLVVHRVHRRGVSGFFIDEMFCAKDDRGSYGRALAELIRDQPSTFFAAHAHQASAERSALRSLGFITVKRVPVVARQLSGADRAVELRSWDLSLGDLDGM